MRKESQHAIRVWQMYFCANALVNICSFLQVFLKVFWHAVFWGQIEGNFKNPEISLKNWNWFSEEVPTFAERLTKAFNKLAR